MAITVRVLNLGKLAQFVTKADMLAAGEFANRLQKERIARGGGTRGPMKPYDPEYAEERHKEGLPTSTRTLRRTGKMLDSRGVTSATDRRVTVGFRSPEPYFYAQQKATPFVKTTKEERKRITEFVKQRIKDRLKKTLADARAEKR